MKVPVDAYAGPDRRQRLPRIVHEPNRRLLVTLALAVLAYGVAVPTGVAELLGTGRTVQASIVATIVCAVLFAQGGLLFLLRWRLTGDGRTCLLGVAALLYGFLAAPLAEVFSLLGADATHRAVLEPIAQGLVGIVASVLAARSTFAPPVDSRLRPGRALGLGFGALVVLGAAVFAAFRLVPEGYPHHLLTVAVTALAGLGWLGAGAVLVWRGRGGRLDMSSLLSAPLLVLGLGSIFAVVSVYDPVPFSLDSSALNMAAALLLAGGAAYALLATLSDQGSSALRLRTMLSSLERYRAMEEERVHDARSALLAVQTAVTALTRYRGRLDELSRSNLEVAVDGELERLVELMGKTSQSMDQKAGEVFDVVGPVRTIATAAAAFGVRTQLDVPADGCRAIGKRGDFARVVETLLGNARRYAPGSPLAISVRENEEQVVVTVSDRGPGIATEERDVVFTRGGRGSTSAGIPGSGLGLYSARRLMEDQDGTLLLDPSADSGATFVATLPAAAPDSVPARAARPAAPRGPVTSPPTGRVRLVRPGTGPALATSAAGDGDPYEVA
ncbi:MAG: ATP-binding protein [Acidimicrobiales bacterium]